MAKTALGRTTQKPAIRKYFPHISCTGKLHEQPLTRLLCIISLLSSGVAAPTAQAETSADEEMVRLREITVSATRSERRIDNVPSQVTVTTQAQIEERGARDLKDLLQNEVDISLRGQPGRGSVGSAIGRSGVEGINIRGLEGNQVLMLMDGIRIPNGFSFGPIVTGRGDYVDIDALKSVEVLRGPASTQFGSDGLAGAVSFRTLDPNDILPGKHATQGGFLRASYAEADASLATTAAYAGRSGAWQALVLGRYGESHATENQGENDAQNSNRTTSNPAHGRNRFALAKALYAVDTAHTLGLTAETQRRTLATEVYSSRATNPNASRTSARDVDTRDVTSRERISLEHRYQDPNGLWLQKAHTRLYWQTAQAEQFTAEALRATADDRTRRNRYKEETIGLTSQFESSFFAGAAHRLSAGLEASRSKVSAFREGTGYIAAGDTFPNKPFPDTRYDLLGAFAQDEIELGTFSIIPGLRFDHYTLRPDSAGYSRTIVRLADQAITPRIGLVWRLAPGFAPYAQWAKGFRAPTPDQVNNNFSNSVQGYRSISNPNLKPEYAHSLELGLRGNFGSLRYGLSAYDNRYQDFISQETISGSFGSTTNPATYQYINLAKVRIKGWDARLEWAVSADWVAHIGAAGATGDQEKNGVRTPLDTINPLKTVAGLRYTASGWGARLHIVHSEGKKSSRTQSSYFVPPAYTTLDLGLSIKLQKTLTLIANLNNATDVKYWRWSDVRGLANDSAVKDAYTAPGRNLQFSLRYDF